MSGTCRYVKNINIGDLLDVNITSVADEDILVYDAGTSKWINLSIHDFIGGLNFDFFLSDTADGVIAGYLRMFDAPTGEAESSVNALIVAADTAIEEWITAIGQPTFTLLSAGVYSFHFHADKDGPGKKDVRVYGELYKRAAGGAETLLMTFENSALLTTSPAQYEIHATLLVEETIASDDRLVLKTLGTPEGAGADPTVTIYMEGATATRLEVRSTPTALDERYLRLDSANPMTADLQMDGNNIDDIGVLFLKEQAAADGDVAGSGQIWVKTATPNELWFTDDAGSDFQIGRGFVDRGDPAAADWTQATLTLDGGWHELDLSGIVPVGAKAVLIRAWLKDNLTGQEMFLSYPAIPNGWNLSVLTTRVANIFTNQDSIVAMDGDRKIQYLITAGTDTVLLIVGGWWF